MALTAPPGRAWRIALAGNPNVGKSTLFNRLTGQHQHTGNWSGKTVGAAQGVCSFGSRALNLVDLPGTYSLVPRSREEAAAQAALCREPWDCVIAVCDATRLERSLALALQVMELGLPTVLCVNLMDEGERLGLCPDLALLGSALSVPTVGISAGSGAGVDRLLQQVIDALDRPAPPPPPIVYPHAVETQLDALAPHLPCPCRRWLALRLLEGAEADRLPPDCAPLLAAARARLAGEGWTAEKLSDLAGTLPMRRAAALAARILRRDAPPPRPSGADRVLTSRRTGIPLMFLLLAGVLWLTISGANYPSQWLGRLLFAGQDLLSAACQRLHVPPLVQGAAVEGAYRVCAWVVSVMLPPMLIFFPLFALLEEAGYLPRVAFLLDHTFCRCRACGKQALTMCMGLGCNAVGVTGCRIIDSPRERLVAILTNSMVPCNGRFPTLIALIALFAAGGGLGGSLVRAAALLALLLVGVGATFLASRLLTATVLRGAPSAFTLELPPFRRPAWRRGIAESVTQRALFVLRRAVTAAAPAGLVIWLAANAAPGGVTLLARLCGFLDPFARVLGLDGAILAAFLLAAPANELMLPILLMAYLSSGTVADTGDLSALGTLLTGHGWTWLTALNTMLFSLLHWPCATTCLTIRSETGSWKWTAAAILLPTGMGVLLCACTTALARLAGLA